MWNALLKSPYPDVLRPWGESQVYKNHVKIFEKMNPVVSKFLEKITHPSVSGFSSQSSNFCLTIFECLWVANCVTIAGALGLFRRIWV